MNKDICWKEVSGDSNCKCINCNDSKACEDKVKYESEIKARQELRAKQDKVQKLQEQLQGAKKSLESKTIYKYDSNNNQIEFSRDDSVGNL